MDEALMAWLDLIHEFWWTWTAGIPAALVAPLFPEEAPDER